MYRFCLLSFIFLTSVSAAMTQDYPFNSAHWEMENEGHIEGFIKQFEGRTSLYLFRSNAFLKDIEFFTGEIQFDVFVTESRGFPGVLFRVIDSQNYEEYYIRPHQSGNPDANQYTPVFNGRGAWQLYYGEEFSKPATYKFNQWNTVKLIIAETDAEVYINDMEKPLYYIPELKYGKQRGAVGLRNSGPSGFHFSNFNVTEIPNPHVKSRITHKDEFEPGIVNNWSISSPFQEALLKDIFMLPSTLKSDLKWKSIGIENRGYANLNRLNGIVNSKNTVFAKIIIDSDQEQIKKLSYGFSDRVKIYLNDQILTGGQDGYASRDYRFLGTVGFFDDVYLNLKKGRNELWMAISEDFGGWGVMAKFDDLSGIELVR